MQLLLNHISKVLLVVLLGCVLLTAWNESNTFIASLDESNMIDNPDGGATTATSGSPANSIWRKLSREFTLERKVQSSAQVQAEIRELLADQGRFNQILQAAAPYIYFIHEQTRSRGLPAEIALIPFIESEFSPYDRSKKGATGLWQLMSQTARELGVKVKTGYDGRRNVIASTQAALAYFSDLGKYFNGNWYLAIAAYNCGQVRVQSAVRRAGSKNFWDLRLPKETKHYVPKLLAVATIIKNPKKYGVKLPPVVNKPYFTELKVKKPVSLSKVAKSTDINIKTLRTLNPDNKNGVVSVVVPKDKAGLVVPIAKASAVKKQLQKANVLAAS